MPKLELVIESARPRVASTPNTPTRPLIVNYVLVRRVEVHVRMYQAMQHFSIQEKNTSSFT